MKSMWMEKTHASLLAELLQPMELTESEWMARIRQVSLSSARPLRQTENMANGCEDTLPWPKLADYLLHGGIHPVWPRQHLMR